MKKSKDSQSLDNKGILEQVKKQDEPRDPHVPDSKTILNIIHNYRQSEEDLVKQLHFRASHGTVIGGFREEIWRGMFEQIVPKKFVIEQSVFIMDSEGRVSNEVDLAIFDETYTPYIFRYGRLKFLPIEAVAVAIECKSTSNDSNDLKSWAESIAALKTSSDSIVRTISEIVVGMPRKKDPKTGTAPRKATQTATRPLRILCCLHKYKITTKLNCNENLFDFIIRAPEGDNGLQIEIDATKKTLQDWYLSLSHVCNREEKNICMGGNIAEVSLCEYQVKGKITEEKVEKSKEISLLSLNMQLNQLLMLINNPMLFPHKAYADLFNKFGMGGSVDDK